MCAFFDSTIHVPDIISVDGRVTPLQLLPLLINCDIYPVVLIHAIGTGAPAAAVCDFCGRELRLPTAAPIQNPPEAYIRITQRTMP